MAVDPTSSARAAGVDVSSFKGMSLDTIMMMVNSDRANMLDGQVRAQAATIKDKNEMLVKANNMYAKMKDLQKQAGPDGMSNMPPEMTEFMKEQGITRATPDRAKGSLPDGVTEAQLTSLKDMASKIKMPFFKASLDRRIATLEAGRAPADAFKKDGWETTMNYMKTYIDNLTSSSQLEMTQLQSIMNKFNQTTEGLSNWISKDSQSKNTIVGNQR